MNKKMILTTVAISLFTVSGLTAQAYQGQGGGYGHQTMAGSMSGERGSNCQERGSRHEMMIEILDLTDDQQEKIAAIHEETRTANEARRTEMQEYQAQIRELTGAEDFDADAIRVIAEKKAAIQVEMAISRAQAKNNALAVMTPDQQELAKKLRSAMQHNKQGKQHRGHGGRW